MFLYNDSFICNTGVRQGCPLSPILFTLFTSDLLDEIKQCYGVMLGSRKVAGLMFADDLVLLANNQQDLQSSLNLLYGYCSKWALTVNHSKTKVLVFGGASSLCPFIWSYNGDPLQVFSYRYLGVIFTNTGSFTLAVKTFCQSALKVLNMIRAQSREKGGFTPNVMCLLYSAMVQPILEYSCEVWGVKYFHDIEKVLLKFCKEMLGLPPNASNMAVYGETGTFPQWLRIYYRIIKYFIRIHVNAPPLVSEALTLLKHTPNKRNNWYTATSEIIMKYTYNQSLNANEIVLKEVKRNLQESFINIWKEQLWDDSRVSGGNKLRTYRTFKKDFAWEYYLTRVTKRSHLVALAKFRTSCHSLAIETGRYHKPSIPPEQRLCTSCNNVSVDDEYHFITECQELQHFRKCLYETAGKYNTQFHNLPNRDKMCYLLETSNTPTIRKVAWFVFMSFNHRKHTPY